MLANFMLYPKTFVLKSLQIVYTYKLATSTPSIAGTKSNIVSLQRM